MYNLDYESEHRSPHNKTTKYGLRLNDSPIGLLAWILEQRSTWSDCKGDAETRFSKDEILDTVTTYWVTQCIGTSLRYYYEAVHNLWTSAREGVRLVATPTAFLLMPGEILLPPRTWLERTFNLKRYTRLESVGHFADGRTFCIGERYWRLFPGVTRCARRRYVIAMNRRGIAQWPK